MALPRAVCVCVCVWVHGRDASAMFMLSEIEVGGALTQDTIRVEPKHFSKNSAQAITDQINAKYANRVRDVRLTVCRSCPT